MNAIYLTRKIYYRKTDRNTFVVCTRDYENHALVSSTAQAEFDAESKAIDMAQGMARLHGEYTGLEA